MANIKIAQLTNAITISDTDIVLIEDAIQTKKMTVATLKNLLGINSGGIVESGSNANGSFIKFADGTMICTHTQVATDWIQHAYGAIYGTDNNVWNYPAEFYSVPVVSRDVSSILANTWSGMGSSGTSKTACSFRVFGFAPDGSAIYLPSVALMAIGRWKA